MGSGSSVTSFPAKSVVPPEPSTNPSKPSWRQSPGCSSHHSSPLRTHPQPLLLLVVMVLEAGGPQLVPRRARTVT